MIEAIKTIGELKLKDDHADIIECLTDDVNPSKDKAKQHVVIIDLNTFDRNIKLSSEELCATSRIDYLWLGKAPGNSEQIYFTVLPQNLKHLLTQAIPNIFKRCAKDGRLYILTKMAIEKLFSDLNFSGRYRYVLDGESLQLVENGTIKKIINNAKHQNKKESDIIKEILSKIEKGLIDKIKEKTSLTKKEIGLFSLKINGELLIKNSEYREIVENEKIDTLFGSQTGICSCCNSSETITEKPKFIDPKSALGAYITDKFGFSSNLTGNFSNRFSICKNCYKKLLAGEAYVRNRFPSKVGGLGVYIIPKFIFPIDISDKKLTEWSQHIQNSFNSVNTMKGLEAFEERLERFRDMETLKNSYSLSFLFLQAGTGSETKILKLINDISPTRLEKLRKISNLVKDSGESLLGLSSLWHINLEQIYFLIPLRKRKSKEGKWQEYRKLLELYDNIFSGKPVSMNFLIRQFIKLATIYKFNQFETCQLKKPDNSDKEFINKMMQANLFLMYLRKLDLMRGGEHMDVEFVDMDEGIKQFIKEMNYNEQMTAMFLLGTLVGAIGNKQAGSRKKTILEKINFQGINRGKLIRLSNEIFEKLKVYKLLNKDCETRFSQFKQLTDKNIAKWGLSDQENVFYLLSGYAYETRITPNRAKEKKSKKKNNETPSNQQGDNNEPGK